jgi:hypothetical protein
MDNIFYIVKEIGMSKGFKIIYNKQEQIGVYKKTGDHNYELLTVVDSNNQEIPEKKQLKFEQTYNVNFNMTMDNLNNIKIIGYRPGPFDVLFFNNFQDAVIAKLLMLKKIQEYFDEELEKLKIIMKKNMPEDIESRMIFLENILK